MQSSGAALGGEHFFLVRFWVRAEYYGFAHGDFFHTLILLL